MSRSAYAVGLLAGLALTTSGVAARPAAAATLLVHSIQFVDSSAKTYGTATPLAGGAELTFVMSPFVITSPALDDARLAFCLDFDLDLPIGAVSLSYADFVFELGEPAQVERIGQLVNYGTAIFAQTPGGLGQDAIYELSVIQAAIWTITNPEYAFAFAAAYHPGEPALVAELNARIVSYAAAGKPGYGSDMRTIATADYQPLALGVPEPRAWALMIGGFGGLGVTPRRSRRREPRGRWMPQ